MPSNGIPTNGTDDETTRGDDTAGRTLSRRDLLNATKAAGAGAIITGVAGCSGLTSRRYEAAPVGLGENASGIGYSLQRADSTEISTQEAAFGIDLEATLLNHYAAYRGPETTFALAALPAIEEGGQTLNPLADRDLGALPTADQASPLLHQVDIGQGDSIDWAQRPEVVGRREVSLLDRSTEGVALVGRTGDDEAVLLHLARVQHEGDVVFGLQADVRELAAEDESDAPAQPLSGEGGVFDGVTVENRWAEFDNTLDHGRRIDPADFDISTETCSNCTINGVTITRPGPNQDALAQSANDYDWVSVGANGAPYVELTAAVEVDGDCSVRLEWDYRTSNANGNYSCGVPNNTWVQAGTGLTPTIRLPQCSSGGTTYDVRVQAVDSSGTVLASDTISYYVFVIGT